MLRKPVQFAFSCVLAIALLPCSLGFGVSQKSDAQSGRMSVVPKTTTEARNLPVDEYLRLRNLALSGAKSHHGPRVRNPLSATHGWDTATLSILSEQREFLRAHSGGSAEKDGLSNDSRRANRNASKDALPQAARSQNGIAIHAGLFAAAPASCLVPTISAVNGRAAEAVFTPQAADNHYRIEGCGFGTESGRVWIEHAADDAGFTQGESLALQMDSPEAWSDREIDVHLDPSLSGIPDAKVTLAVDLADGTRLTLPGCHFVAARGEPVLLNTVPASWVKLDATTTTARPIRQLEFLSPPIVGDEVPADSVGASALVARSDSDEFEVGKDVYELSALGPGWIVESVQIHSYSAMCPGDILRAKEKGTAHTALDARAFAITWSANSCSSFIPPLFRFNLSSSLYAVKVWVVGPRGTKPFATVSSNAVER